MLGVSKSVEGYVALPNVPREVSAVHAIEGGDVLLNDAFTRARFESELKSGRYNIVHIASHGQFGSDPSRTFVLAFDGKADDGQSRIRHQIRNTARQPDRAVDFERVRNRERRRPRGTRPRRGGVEGRGTQRAGHALVHQRRGVGRIGHRFLSGVAVGAFVEGASACVRRSARSPPTRVLPTPPIGRRFC